MILNALDEVLFWDDIDVLKTFTKQNCDRFYPHDFENYHKNQESFFKSVIPNKAEFIRRLENYAMENKKPNKRQNGKKTILHFGISTRIISYINKRIVFLNSL